MSLTITIDRTEAGRFRAEVAEHRDVYFAHAHMQSARILQERIDRDARRAIDKGLADIQGRPGTDRKNLGVVRAAAADRLEWGCDTDLRAVTRNAAVE